MGTGSLWGGGEYEAYSNREPMHMGRWAYGKKMGRGQEGYGLGAYEMERRRMGAAYMGRWGEEAYGETGRGREAYGNSLWGDRERPVEEADRPT